MEPLPSAAESPRGESTLDTTLERSSPKTAGSGEPRTIREFLAASVRKFDSKPAVRGRVGGEYRTLSYVELGQSAETFAAGLVRLGLRPGEKVALVAPNGIEWVVGWLGVAMAGGVNVPIYGELGVHEIANIVRQADSRWAIVGAQYARKIDPRQLERVIVAGTGGEDDEATGVALARFGAKGISFAAIGSELTPEDRPRVAVDSLPSDLASIVYTSGTTGDPKGVMLSHRNLTSNAMGAAKVVSVNSRDRLLLVLPLHHPFPFTAGMLAPLHLGAEIVLESDLRRIRERMGEVRPTLFFGVPALYGTMYRAILGKLESDGKLETFRKGERIVGAIKRRTGVNVGRLVFRELHERLGGRIRFFASGGAAIPPDLIRKFALLGIPIIQGWGLTEASPVVAGQALSMRKFLFTDFYERVAGTVGYALPGLDVACIDVPDKNTYVQIHGEGELLIRGPNVMQGYYKNEAATREVMLGEWLRTGDIGRVTKDGLIYLTGRAKSVIVLDSGEKVYPDELEERFEEGGVVHDVCVFGHRVGRLLGERKMQVSAVVYPDPAVVRSRSREVGERLTSGLIQGWVQEEVDRAQSGIAPFKRIGEVILTDQPLPRTDLHKVKRGQVRDHYPFDLEKLLAPAEELG
jgi:long-chain acyl-CoA synthetase